MSETNQKSKRLGCFKIILYFMLLLLFFVAIWLAFNVRSAAVDGFPVVSASAETTRITGPLDANGDVDYLAAINNRCSEGVTLENNAFVKLFQAVGPLPREPETTIAVVNYLEMKPLSENGAYFQKFESWLNQESRRLVAELREREAANPNRKAETKDVIDIDESASGEFDFFDGNMDIAAALSAPQEVGDQFEFATKHPWSSEEFPEIAKWLKLNEPSMKIAQEGIERTHYFYPLVSKQAPRVMGANLAYAIEFRDLGNYLSVNAMSRLGQGDVDGCIENIKSLHKLSIHVSKGPSTIEELIALQIQNIAIDGWVALCASEKANADQLKNLLQWVSQMQVIRDADVRVDQLDRFVGLDAAIAMARGDASATGPVSEVEALVGMFGSVVDWEETLPVLNANYDRFAEVAKIEDWAEFEIAWTQLEEEMVENEKWVMSSMTTTVLMGRKSKGIWLGKLLSGMLMPSIRHIVEAENGMRVRKELLGIVIAASIFKKETGAFPNSLSELTQHSLESPPTDPMTGQSFIYELTETGLRIYSSAWDSSPNPRNGAAQNDRLIIELKKETWQQFQEEDFSNGE